MDYVLFAIALVLLLGAGAGITALLLNEPHSIGIGEYFSLSFLLGTGFISLSQFALGFFLSGLPLRVSVSLPGIALGMIAIVRLRSLRFLAIERKSSRDWLWMSVLFIQFLIVCWVSLRLSLGYDGLFLWEAKARLIFQAGGRMPVEYFRADPAWLPHPNYPLLLPFTESWFYGFLARPHQGWLKLVLPLFYLSAIGLMVRSRPASRRVYLPALLMFFVPVMMIRSTSGEADFPLAVFYLASGTYLLEYLASRRAMALRLAAVLAAILPWVKGEGAILLVVALATGTLVLVRDRKWRQILTLSIPGVAWLVIWRIFLGVTGATSHLEYFPVSFSTIATNIHRVPVIALEASKDLLKWERWSLLWLIPFRAVTSWKQSWAWLRAGCGSDRTVCRDLCF